MKYTFKFYSAIVLGSGNLSALTELKAKTLLQAKKEATVMESDAYTVRLFAAVLKDGEPHLAATMIGERTGYPCKWEILEGFKGYYLSVING